MNTEPSETKKLALGSTIIMMCACSNKYQDKQYGKNQRVHNVGKKTYNCTSCGNKQ